MRESQMRSFCTQPVSANFCCNGCRHTQIWPRPTRIRHRWTSLKRVEVRSDITPLYDFNVPLPSSSMMISESFVADCVTGYIEPLQFPKEELTLRIVAVSNISAMKVEIPLNWLSPAPTRHNTESKIGNRASEQGTNEPICAMSAITPTCDNV